MKPLQHRLDRRILVGPGNGDPVCQTIGGASELEIDGGRGESINDTGVRHLRVEVQKNTPFSRLLERSIESEIDDGEAAIPVIQTSQLTNSTSKKNCRRA